jgi:(p)ppGpp synthase/HD superfamily hydrolase
MKNNQGDHKPMLTSRFTDALTYAAELHAAQRRKVSGEPYLAHLLGAASIVLDYGGGESEAIAALLHDAVEDQGGPAARDAILRRFGPVVVEIIDGCTDTDATPKPPWRERKEVYLERLREATPAIRLVVAADKLHNLRSLARELRRQSNAIWTHFKGGREGTIWYHRSVVEILRVGGDCSIVEELSRTLDEVERLSSDAPQ